MGIGHCKYCGKQVKWIMTPRGKHMPCNPGIGCYMAWPEGPEKIVTEKGEVVRGEFVAYAPGLPKGYRPHWGECKGATKARRK